MDGSGWSKADRSGLQQTPVKANTYNIEHTDTSAPKICVCKLRQNDTNEWIVKAKRTALDVNHLAGYKIEGGLYMYTKSLT